jgi:hypothetical protein
MALCNRHRRDHLAVFDREGLRGQDGPVVIAARGQLLARPRPKHTYRKALSEILAPERAMQLRKPLTSMLARLGDVRHLHATTLREQLALPPRIVYEVGGGASRIHGTSRQFSSNDQKRSSSSVVSDT